MSLLDIELPDENGSLKWYDFEQIGFMPTGPAGGGMPTIANQIAEYAGIDGGFHRGQRATTRRLIITGIAAGNVANRYQLGRGSLSSTFNDHHATRQQIIDAFKPRAGEGTERRIRYRGGISNAGHGVALVGSVRYDSGLEQTGGDMKGFSERIVLVLILMSPFFTEEVQHTAALTTRAALPTSRLWERGPDGYTAIDGETREIMAATYDAGGNVYWATDSDVYFWPGSGGSANLGFSGGDIADIELDQLGRLYVIYDDSGDFKIKFYDISAETWTATTYSVASIYGPDLFRYIYGEGLYISMKNGASSSYLSYYDDTLGVVVDLGNITGGSARVYTAVAYDGKMLLAGSFTSIVGTSANDFVTLEGGVYTQFATISETSGTARIKHLETDEDGTLYAFGDFDVIDGRAIEAIARYNGYAWQPAGIDSGALSFLVNSGTGLSNRKIYFSSASGITPSDGYENPGRVWVYNGQQYRGDSAEISGHGFLRDAHNGRILITDTSTPDAGGFTTVTHTGSADTHPTLTLTNTGSSSATFYQIANLTTGKAAHFNLTLYAGEVVTITFGRLPDEVNRIHSASRGRLTGAYVGSDLETFALSAASWTAGSTQRKAENVILCHASAATLTASLSWHNAHWSFDGGAVK